MSSSFEVTPEKITPENTVRTVTPTEKLESTSNALEDLGAVLKDVSESERFSVDEAQLLEDIVGKKIILDNEGRISSDTLLKWFETPGLLEKMIATVRERLEFAQNAIQNLEARIPKIALKIENFFPPAMRATFSSIEQIEKKIAGGEVVDMAGYQQLVARAEHMLRTTASVLMPVEARTIPEKTPIKRNNLQTLVNQAAAELHKKMDKYNENLALLHSKPKVEKLLELKNAMFEKKLFLEKCIFERDALLKKYPEIFIDDMEDVA